eukprot:CAMPEP_0184498308 /NCGR_PEP_ID=MMETSP0113_2-20130426/38626_1 /TAXON_ID=91329 /ORGANISM="Norrisiella sphaerica, Strain BC52" /LENGTH=340 /DNA_ID=CAMNT_0026885757 /DNA_START=55 /DNA_END=1077 /DNA_ORIENTATION=-
MPAIRPRGGLNPRNGKVHRRFWQLICWVKKILLAVPVALVLSLIAFDWYLFTFRVVGIHDPNRSLYSLPDWVTVIVFHCTLALLLVSYLRCVLTSSAVRLNPIPAGDIPTRMQLIEQGDPLEGEEDNRDGESVSLTIKDSFSGAHSSASPSRPSAEDGDLAHFPRCRRCRQLKPRRAHHCSICGECVLKMDHHCPWVGNCVGLRNYKFFLLFIFYAVLTIGVYSIQVLPIVLSMFHPQPRGSVRLTPLEAILSVVTLSFGVTLIFFLGFHASLVLLAKTTIELAEMQGARSPYSLGYKANWEAVFGKSRWLWLLPLNTLAETGYDYTYNSLADPELGSFH